MVKRQRRTSINDFNSFASIVTELQETLVVLQNQVSALNHYIAEYESKRLPK